MDVEVGFTGKAVDVGSVGVSQILYSIVGIHIFELRSILPFDSKLLPSLEKSPHKDEIYERYHDSLVVPKFYLNKLG